MDSDTWTVWEISTHTPHARRDCAHFSAKLMNKGISTHTPHARRDEFTKMVSLELEISTHTPHARRDLREIGFETAELFISTHTPHARRDIMQSKIIF